VCKSEAVRRAMLAGIVFSCGGQQETSPLGHPRDVAVLPTCPPFSACVCVVRVLVQ
jgi:hypothetical protein